MEITDLPSVNAFLNMISTLLLIRGRVLINHQDRTGHKKYMISALVSSGLFLFFYTIYHYNVGSVPYPHHDWTRLVYFIILIPHIILAAVMGPFILMAVIYALRNQFERHRKIVHWVWPVWIFVSVSGILIYVMLYLR